MSQDLFSRTVIILFLKKYLSHNTDKSKQIIIDAIYLFIFNLFVFFQLMFSKYFFKFIFLYPIVFL